MTVRFACRCGKKLKASDDKIGKKVLCSACGSPVKVPADDTAAVETVTNPTGASETANELLRGVAGGSSTGSKPRKHFAFEDDAKEESPGIDVAEMLRQILFVLLPGVLLIGIVVGGAYWLSARIVQRDETPDLGEVSGKITLDGKPLKLANIYFDPIIDKDSGIKATSSFGMTNAAGEYKLLYLSDKLGAVVGKHRVTIEGYVEEDGDRVPARFENQRGLTAEIKSGSNEVNFDLKPASVPE